VTHPHLVITQDAHDRAGIRRTDQGWLDQAWADPAARVVVIAGGRLQAPGGRPAWVRTADSPGGLRVLLGEQGGVWHFAVLLDPGAEVPESWVGLRAIVRDLAEVSPEEASLIFHAVGLAEWHAVTRFCPRDGAPLQPRASGHQLACTACGRAQFPRTDPAVIMLVAEGEPGSPGERCLLARSPAWPAGRYSTLAGFVEPGESLEDAVRREVAEETGVLVGAVEFFGNQPWPFPASLMLGFQARAVTAEVVVDGDEIEDARWLTRAQMLAEAQAGTIVLPAGVSISRSLIEHWYGGPLPGQWP
jgi:NAD+ diphosphatase